MEERDFISKKSSQANVIQSRRKAYEMMFGGMDKKEEYIEPYMRNEDSKLYSEDPLERSRAR